MPAKGTPNGIPTKPLVPYPGPDIPVTHRPKPLPSMRSFRQFGTLFDLTFGSHQVTTWGRRLPSELVPTGHGTDKDESDLADDTVGRELRIPARHT